MFTKLCRKYLLLTGIMLTTNTAAIDLIGVYDYARNSDPQYKQVDAANRATLQQRPQAISQLLPNVSMSANTQRNDQDISTTGIGASGSTNFNSRGYRLDLTQPVFRRDRFIQLKQANSRILQAAADLEAARQDLIIRTTEAYFNVLAALDNLNFARAEQKSLSRQLEQARQRFDVGLTAITDVQEAQAGYDRAVADEIAAQNEVDNTREALREITGEYFTDLAELGENMPLLKPEPEDVDAWTAIALEQNLQIIAARHAVETARQEVKVQFAGHLPSLDLIASHGYSRTGGRFGDFKSHDSVVGLQLNVPIFSGGFTNSRVKEARERIDEEFQRLEQARRNAQRTTRQSYLGVISGISRVKALNQAVISSETALQATEAGFEVGTRTAVDVVTSERGTSQARRDFARARYDYILDSLRLKFSSGTLTADDITHINSWLKK